MTEAQKKRVSNPVDARRGTALWGINSLRSDALTHLLDDLVDRERDGLADEDCNAVKRALDRLANRASALPDGSFWRASIHSEVERFLETYSEWNSTGPGTEDHKAVHRRENLRKLRNVRQKIAKRIRKNQHVLQNELDLQLIDDMYAGLGELVKTAPAIFKGLATSMARYEERKGKP